MNESITVPQWLINWLLGAMLMALGWALKSVHTSLRDLSKADQEMVQQVHSLALIVAGLQQFQEDSRQFRIEALSKLEYIVKRLDVITAHGDKA